MGHGRVWFLLFVMSCLCVTAGCMDIGYPNDAECIQYENVRTCVNATRMNEHQVMKSEIAKMIHSSNCYLCQWFRQSEAECNAKTGAG